MVKDVSSSVAMSSFFLVRNTAFCFVGDGGTGKTTCLEVISSVFADKRKVVTRLDGKTYRDFQVIDLDTLTYSHISDLYTHEGFMGSDLKFLVGDIGGILLMSVLERPDMDPLDHGLRRRVTFIDVQRPTDEVMTFDKDEACRSLLRI